MIISFDRNYSSFSEYATKSYPPLLWFISTLVVEISPTSFKYSLIKKRQTYTQMIINIGTVDFHDRLQTITLFILVIITWQKGLVL